MRAVSLAPFQHTSPLLLRTAVLYALMLFVSSFFVWHDGMGCTIRTDPSFQPALFRPKKHLANRSLAPFQHTSPFILRTAPDFSVRSAQGSGFHSREFMGCAIRSGPLAYHLGHEHMSNMCSWLTGWQRWRPKGERKLTNKLGAPITLVSNGPI